jgi:uncharacterized membrane protein
MRHSILPFTAKMVVKIKKLNPFQKLNEAAEYVSDKASEWFGRPLSIFLHIVFWTVWIVTRGFNGVDEFPYGELTMILSLEAIFLSMLILNSSTRQQQKDSDKIHESADISAEVREDVKNLHDDIEEILDLLDIPEDEK